VDDKELLAVKDVAHKLSIGETYTRQLIAEGRIRSVLVGKRVLVPRAWLADYLSGVMGKGA
jgi:excisionase family DNA binding protein